ncbi:MAG: diguanylate cyclase [Aquificota bacterium]|nr:diguanylate cyclase [Aquificota bacterium]
MCQHLFSTVRLTHLATTDPLTRIANRRMLGHDLERYGRIAKRYGKNLSLIMLDIDDFKGINDTYGHVVGDEVLKRIASVLKTSVRESDTLYRYGGEEFAVLCPETDKRGAYELAERIRKRVKDTRIEIKGDGLVYVTVSLGIASFPDDTEDPLELLSVTDISLYKAKREGKNRTAVLEGREDRESFLERFRKERELKEFLLKDSITYELQPIYDLKKDKVFGYELLFQAGRWGKTLSDGSLHRTHRRHEPDRGD